MLRKPVTVAYLAGTKPLTACGPPPALAHIIPPPQPVPLLSLNRETKAGVAAETSWSAGEARAQGVGMILKPELWASGGLAPGFSIQTACHLMSWGQTGSSLG